jgi:hypothetical protein
MQRSLKKEVKAVVYEEYFYVPLAIGLFLYLLNLIPLSKRGAQGLALLACLLLPLKSFAEDTSTAEAIATETASSTATSTPAQEQQTPETEVKEAPAPIQQSLWDKNKQLSEEALRKYAAGKFPEATEILKNLQVENPNSPVAAFDLGTSLLKEKKYEDGRATLSEAAKNNGMAGLAAKFNTAGSFAEEKKNGDAQSLYSELIHDLSSRKDRGKNEDILLERAKKNLELLSNKEQQDKQQQQKQNQDQKQDQKQDQNKDKKQDQKPDQKQDSKNGGKDDKKDQGGDQQKQDQGGQGKENEQNKQYDHSKHEFKEREDLSEQDAKRILEALKQQEGTTQKKFLKKLEKQSKVRESDNPNDW